MGKFASLKTGPPPPPPPQEIFLVLISVRDRVDPRIMPMKNSNDTMGNRTRIFPPCSAVPQANALPRAQHNTYADKIQNKRFFINHEVQY